MNDLIEHINQLKNERKAVILAHNYQRADVQDIADFTGDSLELAKKAASLTEEVVVFCGVHFMAETAAMLSPQKVVLLPDAHSGCPMADMATADDVLRLKAAHPDGVVVTYVNSTAAVKAVSDVCCTSSNAVDIVERIPRERPIIFVPDKYLGGHVAHLTGRQIILHDGYCPTHARLLHEHVEMARKNYPGAPVLVHPESRREVCLAADHALSTGQMCAFAKKSDAATIVVGTEVGLLHRLRKENPGKRFVPLLESAICPNMKKNTLEKILFSLQDLTPRITVPKEIGERASQAVLTMLGEGPILPLEAS